MLKKSLFIALFNMCLFILLMIGIQNSSNKIQINILISETIELPVGFTLGTSFIAGSILGSLVSLD
tara:strand:- start:307 stop:504 length:198 start_codon:yes stop_codon:yes gene_type:complete